MDSMKLSKNIKTPDPTPKAGIARAVETMKLSKNIKTPDPTPKAGIARAVEIMETGRLYRYNADCAENSEVAKVEQALAAYTGHKYCVGLNSCGSAIYLSLMCVGVQPGDKVLSNVFTFSAVPSAIVHARGVPVYVNCTSSYVMDPADLERKAASSQAKFCVVSHMRGKVADMDAIRDICNRYHIVLVEDCAHSLGVTFNGTHTGHHGIMASFSSQSYKMLNSGEGGFLVTDDDDLAARAILYAGSYEKLYKKHLLRPPDAVFEKIKTQIPNFSMRMNEVSAAIIRPQIKTLDDRIQVYNERYHKVEERLNQHTNITVPVQLPQVGIVGDSIQFNLRDVTLEQSQVLVDRCAEAGMPVEVFGAVSNARNFMNWHFAKVPKDCTDSLQIIQRAVDLRLPLQFEDADFDLMADIVLDSLDYALKNA